MNINAGFGATATQALVEAVRVHRADYGVALDGDADRVQLADATGRLYNGDELLYVIASDRLQQGLPVPGVVGTLMTNMAVELALRELGLDVVRARVGDRYVLEELQRRGWQLGGEGSGHLLTLDRHTTGDGIVSALMVLQAAVRSKAPLAGLLDSVVLFPQTMINVPVAAGDSWRTRPALAERTAEVERELGRTGRVLIRASGTEPVVRVMVEARDAAQAKRCAERIAQALTETS